MRKTWITIILVAAVAVGITVFFVLQKKSTKDTIRIGAILPLTGEAAQYGGNDREGILLAVNEANAAGGINGRKIEVVFEDCQTDAKLAITAFNKLRAQGVEYIVDDAISTISLAMAPLLDGNKAVLISTGASNSSLSGISPFFFRIWNSDAFEGVVTADYIKKMSPSPKLGILYLNSDYGTGLRDVIVKNLGGSAVQIAASESFDKSARDFRSQIAKLKESKPDLIYLVGYAAQTGNAAKQLREDGVTAPIIGTVAMEDPEFLKLAGPAAEGVIYPFPIPASGQEVEHFKAKFKSAYNKDPGLLHDCGYDAANLLIKSIKEGGASGTAVREKLAGIQNFAGASGIISFDGNGDVHKPMQMKVIRAGKFVPVP